MPNNALVHLRQNEAAVIKQHKAEQTRKAEKERKHDFGDRLRTTNKRHLSSVSPQQLALARDFVAGHDMLQSFLHTFGILSLSATPRSILMWSHYGAHHSGVCFEFERSPTNKLGTDAKPVIYFHQRRPDVASHPHASPMLLKYKGWSYEREWRLLEEYGDRLYDFPGKLMSVICGARMPLQKVEATASIVASLNFSRGHTVAVKTAEMNPTTFRLAIRPHQATRQSKGTAHVNLQAKSKIGRAHV